MSRAERIFIEEPSIPGHPLVPTTESRVVARLRERKGDRVHPFEPSDVIPGHFDPDSQERRRS